MNRKMTTTLLLSFFGTAMLYTGGCQPLVTQTISPSQPDFDPSIKSGIKENVVLMPMADYSHGNASDKASRRQARIMAALSHQLSGIGMLPAIQEDVNAYLFNKNIISPVQEDISQYDPEKWGSYVKGIADSIITSNSDNQTNNSIGVSPEIIKELGARFHSPYLLRGRIIEYRVGQDRTFNPLRRGILPFAVDGSSSTLFGIAKSDQYDLWQEMTTAGTVGALIGTNASGPYNGSPSAYGSNAAVWGAVGAGTAYLAHQGGDVPEARIQLELALQSTSDGQVLWSNRTEFTVTPGSAYDRYDQQYLLAQAMEEAAASLVRDMRRHIYGVQEVATAPVQPLPAMQSRSLDQGQKLDVYPPMPQQQQAAKKKP